MFQNIFPKINLQQLLRAGASILLVIAAFAIDAALPDGPVRFVVWITLMCIGILAAVSALPGGKFLVGPGKKNVRDQVSLSFLLTVIGLLAGDIAINGESLETLTSPLISNTVAFILMIAGLMVSLHATIDSLDLNRTILLAGVILITLGLLSMTNLILIMLGIALIICTIRIDTRIGQ